MCGVKSNVPHTSFRMSQNKKKEETAPSMNPEERSDLEDFECKEKWSSSDTT
jgi:hypothetical protein